MTVGAVACIAIAAWWWLGAERLQFYTDGGQLRTDPRETQPRDVLWRAPDPVTNAAGDPIDALDVFVSADESTMLLTRATPDGDTDLVLSERLGLGWQTPIPLDAVNSPDNEIDPALSPDGTRLYFASDRPGGAGGLDIWVSRLGPDGWSTPEVCAFSSNSDDTAPVPADALRASGAFEEAPTVLFASDRGASEVDPQADGTHASLFAAFDDGRVETIVTDPGASLGDPAVSPSGDFLYWTRRPTDQPDSGTLQRARVVPGAFGSDEEIADDLVVADLGGALGGHDKAEAPSLTLEGFAIWFISDDKGEPRLYRAVSKEVYLSRSTAYGGLLGLIPWILLALGAVIALSLVRMGVRDVKLRAALGTLGLMARCVLVSLLLHAGLMALLTVLDVPEETGAAPASSTGRVTLASSSLRASIADQLRSQGSSAELSQAEAPMPDTPDVARPRQGLARPAFRPAGSAPGAAALSVVADSPSDAAVDTPMLSQTEITTASSQPVPATELAFAMPAAPAPAAAAPEPAAGGIDQAALPPGRFSVPDASVVARGSSIAKPSYRDAGASQAVAIDADTSQPAIGDASTIEQVGTPTPEQDVTLPEIAGAELDIAMPSAPTRNSDRAEQQAPGANVPDTLALLDTGTPDIDLNPGTRNDAARAAQLAPDRGAGPRIDTRAQASLADADAHPRRLEDPGFVKPEIALPTLRIDTLALPEPVALFPDIQGLVVDAESGEPLARAAVRLDLADREDLIATTDRAGRFGLSVDEIPDNAALTATRDGYAPGAVNIAEADLESGDDIVIRLRRLDPYLIVLEQTPEVHHLGDDAFTGRINSQFQRESEGLSLEMDFELNETHARLRVRGAELRLFVKGTQLDNTVRINGRRIGILEESPGDGSFGEQALAIPSGTLRLGTNTIELRSVDSPGTDHDDFEFVNVRVVLLPDTGESVKN